MKVLFVCMGNAHRSPLAEALLKRLRPDLQVDSAGIDVAIPVAWEVRAYLAKQGAEKYLKKAPEGLYSKKLGEYDVIVVMEQRHKDYVTSQCPECASKIVVWDVEDPYFMSGEKAKETYRKIEEKVAELSKSI
jgi:protein-tyrosine phosphatase